MRSLRLGKVMGIPVELHSTFILLLLAMVVFLAVLDPANLIPSLALFIMLFVSVFVHELFHSLVAVSKGSHVERIVLLPIGGVSMTSELPEKPWDEFLVAIAGPMFNFAVVVVILALVAIFPALPWPHNISGPVATPEAMESAILQYPLFALFYVNLILGAFNLLVPALPLDGGRVLRAVLASFVGFGKATHIATRVSTFFAILLGVVGFFSNWILLVIAMFIYLGASAEDQSALLKETLRGVSVREAVNPHPFVLHSGLSIADAVAEMERHNKTAALVMLQGGFGYIDVDAIAQTPKASWAQKTLGEAAKAIPAVDAKANAGSVLTFMLGKGVSMLPVAENRVFLGVVEESEINKLYNLHKLRSTAK